jgi:hypothetical protein
VPSIGNDEVLGKDTFMKKLLFLLLLITPLAAQEPAYEQHEPILLKGIHATADEPYIIEGYEITNPYGDCIKIMDSEYVIIRDNYLHGCGTDEQFQQTTDHFSEGYATLIGESEYITFENNTLDGNFRGFMAYSTEHLLAENNEITNTYHYSPLWCERCDHSEFMENYLQDNGDPEGFWVPGDRSIGIWVKRSTDVRIHGNTVIRSTSDGIAVTGQIYGPSFTVPDTFGQGPRDDYTGYSTDVWVYDNLLLDNMEQGVWLVNGRDIRVFNNTIRTGCFTYGTSISTEFNVGDSEFYDNRFLTCCAGPPGGNFSFNIYIHDNVYYSWDGGIGDFMYFSDRDQGVAQVGVREGAVYEESHDNREENNVWVELEGALAEEMREKRAYADEHETYVAKGWFVCEQEDGMVDEACVESEEAKGKQGVPREMLLYSSLMADFDAFVVEMEEVDEVEWEEHQEEIEAEPDVKKEEEKKTQEQGTEAVDIQEEEQRETGKDPLYEELLESWPASIIGLVLLVAVIVSLRFIAKRKVK